MAPSWPWVKSRVKFLHLPVKSYHQPLNLGRYLGCYRRQPLPWALPRALPRALLRALPRALPRAPLLRQHSLPRMCNYRNLGRHLGRYLRRPLLWSLPRARRPQMHPVIHVLCGRRRAQIQLSQVSPQGPSSHPPKDAVLFTWHSFRSGVACALRAAGAPDGVLLALLRWRSKSSIPAYGRLSFETTCASGLHWPMSPAGSKLP